MNRSLILAFVAAMFVGHDASGKNESEPAKSKLQFSLRLCEGDPIGKVEAGTLKVLTSPRLIAFEHQPCTVHLGSQIAVPVESRDGPSRVEMVDIGQKVTCTAGAIKDGTVSIDLTMSNITPGEKNNNLTQIHTDSTRLVANVALNQVMTFMLPSRDVTRRSWIELKIESVK